MPTPVQPESQPQHDEVVTEYRASDAPGRLESLPENYRFRYWVDPNSVSFVDGEPLYLPVRIAIEPGVQNVRADGESTPIDALQRRHGRVDVPLDFEVQAWGRTVKGYAVRRYIGTDLAGKRVHHWHDVWTRYVTVGTRTHAEFDSEGWLDFRRRVAELVGPPHQAVVAAARLKAEGAVSTHISIDTESSRRQAERIRANLP